MSAKEIKVSIKLKDAGKPLTALVDMTDENCINRWMSGQSPLTLWTLGPKVENSSEEGDVVRCMLGASLGLTAIVAFED